MNAIREKVLELSKLICGRCGARSFAECSNCELRMRLEEILRLLG